MAHQKKPGISYDPSEEREEKIKRKRKTKDEVIRSFECVVKDCTKAYGSAHKFGELAEPAHQTQASRAVGEVEECRERDPPGDERARAGEG